MVDILFRPDNRFLSFSTNDFSIYGAQPDPAVTISAPQPVDPDTGLFPASATSRTDSEQMSLGTHTPVGAVGIAPEVQLSSDGSSSLAPHVTFAPVPEIQPHHATDAAPLAPIPMGASTPPDLLTGHTQPAQDLHPEAPAVPGTLAGEPAPTIATPQFTTDTIHTATQPVDATTAFALDTVGATAATVTGAIGSTVAAVGDALPAATATVGDATAGLGAALQQAGGAAGDQAHDLLAGVGGSDPAGGVATLVGMVSTDGLFDLRHVGADEQTIDGSPSAVDQLIGTDADASPLLGDVHHDVTAAVGATDSHLHHDLGL